MSIKVLEPEVVSQIAAGEVVEQLALFAATPALLEELQKLDISSMTPLEALNKLYELQQKAKEE